MMSPRVARLRAEYREDARGLGCAEPRLSWIVEDAPGGYRFDRVEFELTRPDGSVETEVRLSGEQVLVPWPFAPLRSRERARLRVRIGDGTEWSASSDPLELEVGLLERGDWTADFVTPRTIGGLDDGAPLLFREAELAASVVRARLYVTAHGLYDFRINGEPVTDDVLTPGWTAYEHRLRYQVYDVTALLAPGANVLSATLGNGWYRGQLVWPGNRSSYGDRLALLAQLEVEHADGSRAVIGTDGAWRARPSSVLFDDFYDGQTTDLRVSDIPTEADLRGTGTDGVVVLPWPVHELVAPLGPSVRITGERLPETITPAPDGGTLVDFGQNLVGWVQLRVRAEAGTEVVVRHSEVLEDGRLALRPLRSAKATSRYLLTGGEDVLRPTFTFNGFRYAEISGVPTDAILEIHALVVGSDLRRTGWWESSDPMLDRLHENVVWGMRGNFLDVPTDCPQRDERLGWTGDIQVFTPTADFLYDTSGFLANWLQDLAAEQKPDGGVPFVIPDVLRAEDTAAAAWSDAATIVPSEQYRAYGDRALLERQYPSMRAWVDKVTSLATPGGLWEGGFQFGDWLDPTAPPDAPDRAQADPAVLATAYYARSAALVADAARVLGFADDEARYGALAARVRNAFGSAYVGPDGLIRSDCQAVYAIALHFDLLDGAEQIAGAGRRLEELVRAADYRVGTGFVGTPVILHALTQVGAADAAYRMLLQTDSPSWLYAVRMGATTIWERWDSLLPDGRVNPGEMTSFNHYAYGAVADWLHGTVAGVTALEPGYRRVRIAPLPGGGLTRVAARLDSPYGRIGAEWRRTDDDGVELTVEIPYGVTAHIALPGVPFREVGPGEHHLVAPAAADDTKAVLA